MFKFTRRRSDANHVPLHIKGGVVWHGERATFEQRDIYLQNGRVVSQKPAAALVLDVHGLMVFPGFINAHDHLELNHFLRTKFRERYDNAHQWGEDVNARLNQEPFTRLRAYALRDKLFIGGLKNLLCGATTVAHHNPLHNYLTRRDFPVRVLQRYGWAHSLHFSSDDDIKRSYRRTPTHIPWFIHLAEGTDDIARAEYGRLKALGCVGPNTVMVHGVGLTNDDIRDAAPLVRGLVWCPSTNHYLLGQSIHFSSYAEPGWRGSDRYVALGSDSRLTAAGDLMDEVRFALQQATATCDAFCVYEAITNRAAHIIGLQDVGHLRAGAVADVVITPRLNHRADHALIIKGGIPQLGDPHLMQRFTHVSSLPAILNGVSKRVHPSLARMIQACTLKEAGLEIDELT